MGPDGNGIQNLLEQADDLLTDSKHPLDQVQTAKVTLMMQQQIVNMLLIIQRDISDLKVNIQARREALDERIGTLETEVKAIKMIMAEYPSITWLLRYKTTPTMKVIAGVLLMIYIIARNYPALAAWWGLPPLP